MSSDSSRHFIDDVQSVMGMRLSMLPTMWMLNPAKAEKETRKMFSEKQDAYEAMHKQLVLAPTLFWFDLWQGFMKGDRDGGVARAFGSAERRISQPYLSRVKANRKRLSSGG